MHRSAAAALLLAAAAAASCFVQLVAAHERTCASRSRDALGCDAKELCHQCHFSYHRCSKTTVFSNCRTAASYESTM